MTSAAHFYVFRTGMYIGYEKRDIERLLIIISFSDACPQAAQSPP